MKRISILSGLLLLTCLCAELTVQAENWQVVQKVTKGTYMSAYNVSASSIAGTALWDANVKRGDAICFNNNSFAVWLGTTSATQHKTATRTLHENITIGFPVVSSGTFSVDGGMSGQLYVTCEREQASCDIRCMEGLVR